MLNPKRQQQLLLGLIIALSILMAVGLYRLLLPAKPSKPSQKPPIISTGAKRSNPQEVWVHAITEQMKLNQTQLEILQQSVDTVLKRDLKAIQTPAPIVGCPVSSIQDLKDSLQSSQNPAIQSSSIQGSTFAKPPGSLTTGVPKALQKISLNLHQKRLNGALKTTDNTVPAGAFAEALLLGGVDASTAIQASSDPRPILLRLTHPGTLPRRFHSDLEGCHVLAASFGELSSERVFMRLEKLSCVERKTGEVLEMPVQGYVAGEDGRAGLRGVVVDRTGPNMRNAMIGGFFSSMGKFLGQNRSPFLFSPQQGLVQQNALSGTDLLKQSAGQGLGGALDKYAEFYIKRAEQMQPIIQVAAGRIVDVVFTNGFDFSDSALRKALSKSHDQGRFQQLQQLSSSTQEPASSLSPFLIQSPGEKE